MKRRPTTRLSRRRHELQPVREEISDLLGDSREDRFSCSREARKKAMDFLARREYGRLELLKKLTGGGFEHDAAEQAIAKLAAEGLQCDQRFAESFVQSRVSQGKGPVRIRLDLGQRRIADVDIESAIEACGVDWSGLARDVRYKKFGGARPADFREKARQMRFLQYRGFEPDQIQQALDASD